MKLIPTARLRFIEREPPLGITGGPWKILQQYWAEDMPAYMRDQAKGEWRDVPLEIPSP